MYDSIHLTLYSHNYSSSQLDTFTNKLENVTEKYSRKDDSFTIVGNYKNLKIVRRESSISLNGSCAKFYLGNNVQTLLPDQINPCLKLLCSETGLPWLKGNLRRVDVADCLRLDHRLLPYLKSLRETPRYARVLHGAKSVKYIRANQELVFYDKFDDVVPTPLYPYYRDGSALRIELRVKKDVRATYLKGARNIFGVHLLSQSFQHKLATAWYKHYQAIVKKHTVETNPIALTSWKYIRDRLAAERLKEIGMMGWFEELEILALQNGWSSDCKHDIKSQSKRLFSQQFTVIPNEYMVELDQKVKESVIYQHWLR